MESNALGTTHEGSLSGFPRWHVNILNALKASILGLHCSCILLTWYGRIFCQNSNITSEYVGSGFAPESSIWRNFQLNNRTVNWIFFTVPRIKLFIIQATACKAIPIKCFVSHRPPSREGGSVGRAKKK